MACQELIKAFEIAWMIQITEYTHVVWIELQQTADGKSCFKVLLSQTLYQTTFFNYTGYDTLVFKTPILWRMSQLDSRKHFARHALAPNLVLVPTRLTIPTDIFVCTALVGWLCLWKNCRSLGAHVPDDLAPAAKEYCLVAIGGAWVIVSAMAQACNSEERNTYFLIAL
jgi:hypothetical protein